LGVCGNKGSFRGIVRKDGLSVLLHRFRPAEHLFQGKPIIKHVEPPDFTVPFVTRFIGAFKVAGSAYLVEPLPRAITLTEAWRHVLIYSYKESFEFINVLIKQLVLLLSAPTGQDTRSFGGVHLDNIVLTQYSSYGILADCIDSEAGPIQLRPIYALDNDNNFAALSIVIEKLLAVEASMSNIQNRPILPYDIHNKISQFVSLIKTVSKEKPMNISNINELTIP